MWRKLKSFLKIMGGLVSLILVVLIILFYRFSTPKSDVKIEQEFSKSNVNAYILHEDFKNFTYRLIATQEKLDSLLPTIVFIHGSIGSALDFKKYMTDARLNEAANLISYDRIGYGIHHTGDVQESILFESQMLQHILEDVDPKKTIIVGYSYGGPIALAIKNKVKSIILLAPAVYSEVEPMPWVLNIYNWRFTRWLLPKIWEAASKEKLSHSLDLKNFEQNWQAHKSKIVSIHGKEDWIVPFENSEFLQRKFPKDQFDLIMLDDAGHSLVWTNFEEIKTVLMEQLN